MNFKKILCLGFAVSMSLMTACSSSENKETTAAVSAEAAGTEDNNTPTTETTTEAETSLGYDSVDLDLTQLSSTVVYSEVYNMMTEPEKYDGKTVKMKGNFAVYQNEQTGQLYYACLIADATSCCAQGIEFVLNGDAEYPNDYPEINEEIIVTGTFGTYMEDGYQYCQLTSAVMG